MAKLGYTDLKPRVLFVINKIPHEVIESQISKKSRQKASMQTKIKNLITGNIIEKNFSASEYFDQADIQKEKLVFVYKQGDKCIFHHIDDKSKRITVESSIVEASNLLKESTEVTGVYFDEKLFSVYPPIKVNLQIKDAPPSIKGNTAVGGNKKIVLETGAVIDTPLFINTGDIVSVNTQTGEYVERVEKSK